MTPLDLARNLARSDDFQMRATGVAIVARGLSDESPSDPFRQPWPVDVSVERAIAYLGLDPDEGLTLAATTLMPMLSDAILNRSYGTRAPAGAR
jgi:hypothetical protein